ncbi:hypothetical protein TNCV_1372841 [Trichonephila clavipes]|uniref:Uncharacterized protein n=1 Tax=Trichonephila clavipes TaxID=2585209 RepID=A0A8X7BKJ9_TRICX|nr:hypothetical protein TNCV_1372841 [Trichonephila clavipes]
MTFHEILENRSDQHISGRCYVVCLRALALQKWQHLYDFCKVGIWLRTIVIWNKKMINFPLRIRHETPEISYASRRLSTDLACIAALHGGSLVVLGSKKATIRCLYQIGHLETPEIVIMLAEMLAAQITGGKVDSHRYSKINEIGGK